MGIHPVLQRAVCGFLLLGQLAAPVGPRGSFPAANPIAEGADGGRRLYPFVVHIPCIFYTGYAVIFVPAEFPGALCFY